MNKTKFSAVFAIGILLTVAIVASVDIIQTADAIKSKGTKTSKYGQATKSQVCGDRLCIEVREQRPIAQKPPMKEMDSEEVKQKHMEKIQELKAMTKDEMIDAIRSMMIEHIDMMVEKMAEMEQQEIIDHLDKLTDMRGKEHTYKDGDKMAKSDRQYHDGDKMKKDPAKYQDGDKMKKDHAKYQDGDKAHMKKTGALYNEMLNPSQIEYPNIVGFNDLHIEAIFHLIPDGDDSVLDTVVHHHCKVYDDMTAACLLFPTGMGDQDKPYGIEYVIGADDYAQLSEEEKPYWHYHKTELPKVKASLPDLTAEQAEPLMPVLNETYGKVVYFWQIGDTYPIGDPFVVQIEQLYN